MKRLLSNKLSSFWRSFREKRWDWAYLAILVVALIAHGLLLLNDWEYWDGPAVHMAVLSRDFMGELQHYGMNGLPIFGVYIMSMGVFSNITLAFKASGFLCFLLTAFFTYRIGLLSGMISRAESLIVAVIAMTYPVFQASVINDITGYMVGNLCFITGVLCALQVERKNGGAHWLYRFGAFFFFFMGVNFTNSLYVFYFGFLLFWTLYVMRKRGLTISIFIRTFIWRRIDFLILPFLAWGIRGVFYPVSGEYAGYNAFNFNLGSIWFWTKNFLYFGILEPYFTLLVRHPWFTIPIVFILLSVYLDWRSPASWLAGVFYTHPKPWRLIGFGLVLMAMAIFPYVVVSKGPTSSVFSAIPFDPDTRQTILLALPVAIIIMGVVRSLMLSHIRTLSALGVALLVVIVVESCVVHIEDYVDWQIRSVKDQSLIAQLKRDEMADRYSIIWVNDLFPAGGYRFHAEKDFYVYSEWHYYADLIWPRPGHTLIDISWRDLVPGPEYWNTGTDLSGCQAIMELKRNPVAGSDWNILTHYYYYKFFNPDRLVRYLSSSVYHITLIQLTPLETKEATNCAVLD